MRVLKLHLESDAPVACAPVVRSAHGLASGWRAPASELVEQPGRTVGSGSGYCPLYAKRPVQAGSAPWVITGKLSTVLWRGMGFGREREADSCERSGGDRRT